MSPISSSPDPQDARTERQAEIVGNLADVRRRIGTACESGGGDPRAITLVAVTKTFPAQDALTLLELGVADLAESRDQEATAKLEQVRALAAGRTVTPPRWHFVGRIQSRKARSIARYADVVHSVDRAELAQRLDEGLAQAGRSGLGVFIQVSLDGDPERGGVPPDQVAALAEQIVGYERLQLLGVMAVAPLGGDPEPAFAELAAVSQGLRAAHPSARFISAGMSGDLEAALRHGSTHVRVGSALLGHRTRKLS